MQEEKVFENETNKLDNLIPEIDPEEFAGVYARMHTPWKRRTKKPQRNEKCPFCESGLKFKKCECYVKYKETPLYTINY